MKRDMKGKWTWRESERKGERGGIKTAYRDGVQRGRKVRDQEEIASSAILGKEDKK